MNISDNFTRAEAEKSQTARRLGINNTIPDLLLKNVIAVAENVLEPVRLKYGVPFSPSSWYRSEGLCLAIGSKKTSQHAKGEAVDFEVPGISNMEVAEFIAFDIEFDQLILEYYDGVNPNSGWIHVSYKADGSNRGEILRFNGHNYKRGLS
ncbi:MAG: hypothetical protein JKX96_07740 [Acinetobacter sp.]|nr:hypothetical protein [Acinetobacter sp.]